MRPLLIFCTTLLFLIPISTQALHDCHSAKAFLGINSDEVSPDKAKILNYDNRYGSFVTRVHQESAAADAGIQAFDYVYGIDDLRTTRSRNLTCLLQEYDPGETATLHLVRNGKAMTKSVKFRDRSNTRRGERSSEERAFLGVDSKWDNHDARNRADGIPVNVVRNSTAEGLGMKNNDYLTAINNKRIIDWSDVTAAMNTLTAGDQITVDFTRNGKALRATAAVKSRAASGRNDVKNYNYNTHHKDYAYLGIHTRSVSKDKARTLGFENPYGVYVKQILPRTAAEKAGLQVFDYIYGIDEYRMGVEQSLTSILKKYRAGDTAELLILRKGEKRTLPVNFTERFSDDRDDDDDECEDPFLGVRKQYNDSDYDGVAINTVGNSTAEAMGLRNNDVITFINGYRILDWSDLSMAIHTTRVGEEIRVSVVRNGEAVERIGLVKSECDTRDDYNYYEGDDWEDRLENRMEKLGDQMERMGEKIGDTVEDAIEGIFDNDRADDDWENRERDRRPNTTTDINLDRVQVAMEDMPTDEMRTLADRADISVPANRTLDVNQLNLSPNPNMGMFELSFDLPQTGDTRIRIFNAVGRMIYEYELGNFSGDFNDPIDISQNGAGAYFLIIEQNGQALTKKIILSDR